MRIAILYRKDSGADYHRLLLPYSRLTELGHEILQIEVSGGQSLFNEVLRDVDYVVWNRVCPYNLDIMLAWKNRHNFKIVVDLDDYWKLPVNHNLYNHWAKQSISEHIQQNIHIADIVTCTTNLLRRKVLDLIKTDSNLSKDVCVLPNALPYDILQFSPDPIEHGGVNLMYTGGDSHYFDLKTIKPTIQRFNELKDLNFIVAGFNIESETSKVHWAKIENLIKSHKNAYFKYNLPLGNYMEHYNEADIVIAPLEDTQFNHYKSPLKIIEAGCMNLPIVCSDISPYKEVDFEGIFHCKSNKEWFEVIKTLYNDKEYREHCGNQLGKYVRNNYNLSTINKDREKCLKRNL